MNGSTADVHFEGEEGTDDGELEKQDPWRTMRFFFRFPFFLPVAAATACDYLYAVEGSILVALQCRGHGVLTDCRRLKT